MRRCLQLASLGAGNVAPNPMVGAVLVYHDRIIGEGYHQEYGKAHAEVNCLKSVAAEDRNLIPQSTLYVSLEPCSHYGKTPPCADLIIQEKIGSVKVGCIDINKKVRGQGILRLRNAGVKVDIDICTQECFALNKRFFTFHTLQRPYIILKWAQSQNGKIGIKDKRVQISNKYTNKLVHKWRSEEASILIGNSTAQVDDPMLTNRFGSGRNPVRIVLAGNRPPENLKMYNQEGRTIVFNKRLQKETDKVTYIKIDGEEYLEEVVNKLYELGIMSVLVEGGSFTHQQFLDEELWDECRIITNTRMIISKGIDAPELHNVTWAETQMIQDDMIGFIYNPLSPFASK